MNLHGLNLNWFDLVLVLVLIAGLVRGRKAGMSAELLPLLQWLGFLVVGAYTYSPFGRALNNVCNLGPTFSNIAVYVFEAIGLAWAFNALKHAVGDKLMSADAFGKGEYNYGMIAGAFRYFAVLLMMVSILNAIPPKNPPPAGSKGQGSPAQRLPLPDIGTIQQHVFGRSLAGPYLRTYVGNLLLKPASAPPPQKRDTLGTQRQKLLDEAAGAK